MSELEVPHGNGPHRDDLRRLEARRRGAAVALFALAGLAAPARAQDPVPKPDLTGQRLRLDEPVAIVDSRVITLRQVAKRARAFRAEESDEEARWGQAFRELFLDAVLDKSKVAVDSRLIDEQVRRQTRLREEQEGSRGELQALLAQSGQTYEDYRSRQKDELRRMVLYESLSAGIGPTGRPSAETYASPREQYLWYRRNEQAFRSPAAIRGRALVVPFDLEGGASSRNLARDLHERIAAGASLAELARENSSWNPAGGGELSGDLTGALDWVSVEEDSPLPPTLRRVLQDLPRGLLPEPIRTLEGWALVEVVEARAASRRPFEDPGVQAEIARKIQDERRREQERRTQDQILSSSYLWPPGVGTGR